MQFVREQQTAAEQAIAARICQALYDGKRVLWLISGGSNIAAEVAVMERVRNHCSNKLEGLAIMPMDERYGPPGHADSNVQALREAGFDPGDATLVDVLMHDVPFDATLDFYTEVAGTALASASVIIGQFGLGGDGHTAGVLPGSPAAEADASTVAGYEWDDYTRLTLTPTALRDVTVGYVLAYGASKKGALNRLYKDVEDLSELPAKLLQQIAEVYVYNDAITSEG